MTRIPFDPDAIRALADRSLGVSRSGPELAVVCAELEAADDPGGDRPATLVALLLARAALRREESRGGHHRTDFPEARPGWRLHQVMNRQGWWTVRVA